MFGPAANACGVAHKGANSISDARNALIFTRKHPWEAMLAGFFTFIGRNIRVLATSYTHRTDSVLKMRLRHIIAVLDFIVDTRRAIATDEFYRTLTPFSHS
jgi:hypothetical protein